MALKLQGHQTGYLRLQFRCGVLSDQLIPG